MRKKQKNTTTYHQTQIGPISYTRMTQYGDPKKAVATFFARKRKEPLFVVFGGEDCGSVISLILQVAKLIETDRRSAAKDIIRFFEGVTKAEIVAVIEAERDRGDTESDV